MTLRMRNYHNAPPPPLLVGHRTQNEFLISPTEIQRESPRRGFGEKSYERTINLVVSQALFETRPCVRFDLHLDRSQLRYIFQCHSPRTEWKRFKLLFTT